MVTGIIGRKVGMTQIFDADGTIHPATVIKAGPCVVVQSKTAQADGQTAHSREVRSAVAVLLPAGVLAERHVENPVLAVLDTPMAANRVGQSLGPRRMAADVQTRFPRLVALHYAA